MKILIVDDSPAMRGFIRRALIMTGLTDGTIPEAAHGREALDIVEREPVDLILTDINMPVMNGEELVQRLSEMGLLETTPVVVVSTDSTESRVGRLMTLGAKGYLRKPFQPEALREELARVLASSRREEEWADALDESVRHVLETMCFSEVMGEEAPEVYEERVAVQLAFLGKPSGLFAMEVNESSAVSLAGSFLGAWGEQIELPRATEVLCELANIICGSTLSRVEAGAQFRLLPPSSVDALPDVGIRRTYRLEDGTLEAVVVRNARSPVAG